MRRIFTLLAVMAIMQVKAQTILSFDFGSISNDDPVTFASTSNAVFIQSSTISRGSGLFREDGTDLFNASGFTSSSSLNTSDYFQFTVTPASGKGVSISSITFKGRRASGSGLSLGGPSRFSLRSSGDGYDDNLGGVYSIGNGGSGTTTLSYTFSFSPIVSSTPVTFRIYGYAAENFLGASGEFGIGGGAGPHLTVQGSEASIVTQPKSFQPDPINSGNPIDGNVLEGDVNPFGGTLTATIVDQPITGSVALSPNGDFTYTPPANFEGGLITFTYMAGSTNAPGVPSAPTEVRLNYVALIVTPVNFVSFTANKVSGGTQLTWNVADEIDVARYEVEKNSGNGFQKIGQVVAGKRSSYSFIDAQTSAGTVQYRVRNVDIDGQFKYTNIISFKNGVASVVLKAFPLPAKNSITVQHTSVSNGRITLSAANGQIVKALVPQKGSVQSELNLEGLKAGMYLLRFDAGDGKLQTIKIIKQ